MSFGLVGSESQTRTIYLDTERGQMRRYRYPRRIGLFNRSRRQASTPKENDGHCPKARKDEWLEIELGDFFNEEDKDGELEMSVLEVAGWW